MKRKFLFYNQTKPLDRRYYRADKIDYFQNDTPQDQQVSDLPEKIKLGDEEYTQDELQQLVGLGKIGRDAEQKYNVKIDGVWQNFQRTVNEKKELEQRLAEVEQRKIQEKANQGEDLSPEERRKLALQEADTLGLIHQGNVESKVLSIMQGYQLLNDARGYLAEQEQDGNPKASVEDLLNYMNGQNPYGTRYGSIEKAYQDMFESELETKRQEKLQSIRPSQFVTSERSAAGSRQPQEVKPNKDNLAELVSQALRGS